MHARGPRTLVDVLIARVTGPTIVTVAGERTNAGAIPVHARVIVTCYGCALVPVGFTGQFTRGPVQLYRFTNCSSRAVGSIGSICQTVSQTRTNAATVTPLHFAARLAVPPGPIRIIHLVRRRRQACVTATHLQQPRRARPAPGSVPHAQTVKYPFTVVAGAAVPIAVTTVVTNPVGTVARFTLVTPVSGFTLPVHVLRTNSSGCKVVARTKTVGFFDHRVVQTCPLHARLAHVHRVLHAGLAHRSGKPGTAFAAGSFSDFIGTQFVAHALETVTVVVVVASDGTQRRVPSPVVGQTGGEGIILCAVLYRVGARGAVAPVVPVVTHVASDGAVVHWVVAALEAGDAGRPRRQRAHVRGLGTLCFPTHFARVRYNAGLGKITQITSLRSSVPRVALGALGELPPHFAPFTRVALRPRNAHRASLTGRRVVSGWTTARAVAVNGFHAGPVATPARQTFVHKPRRVGPVVPRKTGADNFGTGILNDVVHPRRHHEQCERHPIQAIFHVHGGDRRTERHTDNCHDRTQKPGKRYLSNHDVDRTHDHVARREQDDAYDTACSANGIDCFVFSVDTNIMLATLAHFQECA